jgi:mRNA-degrading endonuclease HigB of HigAB toxin-antitoxin module
MPYDDILNLTYTDNQRDEVPVGKGDKYRLRIIKFYHLHQITAGDPIEDWLALTQDEYHEYRVSKDYNATSEAVKTRFGRNSEFISQTKWVFAQNYELHSLYLLENVINTCKAIFSEIFGHNDFDSKSFT